MYLSCDFRDVETITKRTGDHQHRSPAPCRLRYLYWLLCLLLSKMILHLIFAEFWHLPDPTLT